jgi:hypothetical protein
MAEEAGRAEDKAKDQGRNRLTLTLFPERSGVSDERKPMQTYTWQELEGKVVRLLEGFLDLGGYDPETRRVKLELPRALIYRLFGLVEEWQDTGKLYLPRMAYVLSRLQEAVQKTQTQGAWTSVEKALLNPNNMPYLKTVLTWLELLCRTSQGGQ